MHSVTTFDDSSWPLLSVRMSGNMTETEYSRFLERMDSYLDRGERFVCVMDVSQCSALTVGQRDLHAEWIHRNEARLSELLLGLSSIVTAAHLRLSRGLLTTLKPMPVPCATVPDTDAALRYVAGRLEGEGLYVSADHLRHRFGLRIRQAG